jgi:LysM repeat protein
MKFSKSILLLGLFVIGSLSLTGCSSSQVDEEVSAEAGVEPSEGEEQVASTDSVPTDNAIDSLDPSNAELSKDKVDSKQVSDAPVADAVPVAEVPVAEAPISDAVVADATNTASAASSEPAVAAPMNTENQPVAEVASGPSYHVKKGDTLMKIAFEQYGDLYRWKEIYNSNRSAIQDPNHLPPGTKLTLNGAGMVTIERNGESYLIKNGDTLGRISNHVYGTNRKWKKLWENNRQLIKDPNRIYAGFFLYYIPEGKLTREEIAPGLKKEESAKSGPEVSAAPRNTASAENPEAAPAPETQGSQN